MEPTRQPSSDITPGRPIRPDVSRQRSLQRPVFNDFTRPTSRPISVLHPTIPPTAEISPAVPAPMQTIQSTVPSVIDNTPSATQVAPDTPALSATANPASVLRPNILQQADIPVTTPPEAQPIDPLASFLESNTTSTDKTPTPVTKPAKQEHRTGHSGLVGFICFIILCAGFFSPLLPGKVLNNFPGSSASFSTGNHTLSCIQNLGVVKSTSHYDTKIGFPITYSSTTSTTLTATCNGVAQTAIGGSTAQFNPLGALINALAALLVAVVIAKIWRRIFGSK